MNMSPEGSRQSSGDPAPAEVAERLHSAAIHVLRRLRVHDAESGLSASRLSALSVVVFAGPIRMGDLAAAEQVQPPSMTRTIADLERRGLVVRVPDPDDGRASRVEATAEGRRLLLEGRDRRVRALAGRVAALPAGDQALLGRAAELLERLALPDEHPVRESGGG